MKIIDKHFSAIIITKKHIIIFTLICLLFLGVFLMIKTQSVTKEKICSAFFENEILSSELHDRKSNFNVVKNVFYKIIGVDFENSETILLNYSDKIEIDYGINQNDFIYPIKPIEKKAKKTVKVNEVTASTGMAVTNATDLKIDIDTLINQKLCYKTDGKEPQILIVHTHTTESYSPDKTAEENTDRSTDSKKNMIAVGDILCNALNKNGIKTIHDTTVHDYPSYSGAYTRSRATVEKNLKKYPSIKIVLDIHRDGITKSDGSKVKVCCNIKGKKTSQCMLVIGTNKELTHDFWQENLKLGLKIQKKATELYPNLMRPVNIRNERFNQQLSKGALIIEVGSNGNTLDESKNAAKYIAEVISKVLKSEK